MNPKITVEHLNRGAVVYVRQSTLGQVAEHTESQRRQYALAESARSMGFMPVTVIDDDLGRSGSGLVERPGFQKLVTAVWWKTGAVFCVEASRLALVRLAPSDRPARIGQRSLSAQTAL
jgi:DNA invertase Pin-like site-specific DNA recombinase